MRNFAASTTNIKDMKAATIQAQTQTFTVNVPKLDIKRFKGLAKAMGWTFEKTEPDYYESNAFYHDIDKAEQEIAAGKGVKVSTIEDLETLLA